MALMSYDRPEGALVRGPMRSGVSIVAIIAAIVSFVLSAKGHGFFALIAAFVAIGAGLLGGLKALSPRVSGGMLSIIAVALGAVAILVALVAIVL